MKKFKKIVSGILIFTSLSFPVVAKASPKCSIKVRINGKTKSYQIFTNKLKDKLGFSEKINFLIKNEGNRLIVTPNTTKITYKKPIESKVEYNREDKKEVKNQDKNHVQKDAEAKGLTADEKQMLTLVNAERKKAGLEPLKSDMRLVNISRQKSKDMIDKKYFGHTSPTYGTPFEALRKNGISYRYAGENLAGASKVASAHNSLMKSPGHRANILNPNFNYIGIGIVDGGPYGKMYTQTFVGTK